MKNHKSEKILIFDMTNRGTALWQTRQNFLFVCLPIGKNPNKNFNDDMTNRGIFPICHWTGTEEHYSCSK